MKSCRPRWSRSKPRSSLATVREGVEEMVAAACEATPNALIADPLHVRATKPHGATSREAAMRVAGHHGEQEWFAPEFQQTLVERLRQAG